MMELLQDVPMLVKVVAPIPVAMMAFAGEIDPGNPIGTLLNFGGVGILAAVLIYFLRAATEERRAITQQFLDAQNAAGQRQIELAASWMGRLEQMAASLSQLQSHQSSEHAKLIEITEEMQRRLDRNSEQMQQILARQ